jgi:hypothetical protein
LYFLPTNSRLASCAYESSLTELPLESEQSLNDLADFGPVALGSAIACVQRLPL